MNQLAINTAKVLSMVVTLISLMQSVYEVKFVSYLCISKNEHMKKTAFILILASCLCSCININTNGGKTVKCNGEIIEKTMDFTGFTGITLEGAAEIDFKQADSCKVLVTANEEVFDYLDYSLEDKVLVISTKDHVLINAKKYKVSIEAPVLDAINVQGAAAFHMAAGYSCTEALEIEIDGAAKLVVDSIEVPTVDLTINGAGKFTLDNIKVGQCDIEVNGAGSGSVSGVADNAKITVSGTAKINIGNLQCPNLEKKVDGFAVVK